MLNAGCWNLRVVAREERIILAERSFSYVVKQSLLHVLVCQYMTIVHERDLISFSSIRSIAYSSYGIIPLNIASCGCRVQTNGVRNAPCYGHFIRKRAKIRWDLKVYGQSLHTWSVPSYACIRPIHRIAQGENIKVAQWRSHGFLFSAIVMYVHQEFVYSTEYMRMRSRIWNLA